MLMLTIFNLAPYSDVHRI